MITDRFNADADLLDLASNGGPTQTHALGDDSEAIDNGFTSLGTDQRGFFRPAGIENDIGSFEVGAIPEPSHAAALLGLIALLASVSRRAARL